MVLVIYIAVGALLVVVLLALWRSDHQRTRREMHDPGRLDPAPNDPFEPWWLSAEDTGRPEEEAPQSEGEPMPWNMPRRRRGHR